jgi:hypothetical protein
MREGAKMTDNTKKAAFLKDMAAVLKKHEVSIEITEDVRPFDGESDGIAFNGPDWSAEVKSIWIDADDIEKLSNENS